MAQRRYVVSNDYKMTFEPVKVQIYQMFKEMKQILKSKLIKLKCYIQPKRILRCCLRGVTLLLAVLS